MNSKLFTNKNKKTVNFNNIGELIQQYKLNLKQKIKVKFYNEIFINIIINKNKINKNKIINIIYKYYNLKSFYEIFITYFINNKKFVKNDIYEKCYKYKKNFINLFAKLYAYKFQKLLTFKSLIIWANKIYKINSAQNIKKIQLINLNNYNDKPIVDINRIKTYIINP